MLMRRLKLAHFKTQHGWQHNSLDEIEPKIQQRAAENSRKRRAQHAELMPSAAKRQALGSRASFDDDDHINGEQDASADSGNSSSSSGARADPLQQPSFYDTLMHAQRPHSPFYSPSLFSPQHTAGSDPAFAAYINNPHLVHPSPPRLRTKTPISATSEHFPGSPVSSAREESPFDPHSRPASSAAPADPNQRRFGSMPPISTVHAQALQQHQQQQQQRGPFSPRPNESRGPLPQSSSSSSGRVEPLSSSDPNFQGSAKEFVAAASTLTGLTRSQSQEAIQAEAARHPPSSTAAAAAAAGALVGRPSTPENTSTPVFPRAADSKQEAGQADAELVLLFAHSPSPESKKSARQQGGGPAGEWPMSQMKGRQLFADGDAQQPAQHNDSSLYSAGLLPPPPSTQPSEGGSLSASGDGAGEVNSRGSSSGSNGGNILNPFTVRGTDMDSQPSYNYASSSVNDALDPAFGVPNATPSGYGLSQSAPIEASNPASFDVGSFFDAPSSASPALQVSPSWV